MSLDQLRNRLNRIEFGRDGKPGPGQAVVVVLATHDQDPRPIIDARIAELGQQRMLTPVVVIRPSARGAPA